MRLIFDGKVSFHFLAHCGENHREEPFCDTENDEFLIGGIFLNGTLCATQNSSHAVFNGYLLLYQEKIIGIP